MPQQALEKTLNEVMNRVNSLFEGHLVEALLFGSYARGDYDEESDVDIALLADCDREELREYQDALASLATDISLAHGQLVSLICIPYAEYVKWLPTLPFYQNIAREGVRLSA